GRKPSAPFTPCSFRHPKSVISGGIAVRISMPVGKSAARRNRRRHSGQPGLVVPTPAERRCVRSRSLGRGIPSGSLERGRSREIRLVLSVLRVLLLEPRVELAVVRIALLAAFGD